MWWQNSKNIYHLGVSLLFNIRYGFPGRKLKVIGVTGTSGKTTTTHMIYEVLKTAGYKVALLSTIKAVVGGKDYDTGFHVTTPDPHNIPKYLNSAVGRGDTHLVIEVSSHALDQNRAAFIPFEVGVLTTLAHEHLDYHKTFENYAKAKFKLLFYAKKAVMPADGIEEKVGEYIDLSKLGSKLVTFGIEKGDVTQDKWQLRLAMPGEFNLKNALAAAAVGEILNIPKSTIKKSLEKFTGLSGRFEEIDTHESFRIIIDFAHKPDALEGIINAARELIKGSGRIIVLYGCASQRDVLKRPIMGEISGRLAEVTVLTDEDPRLEDPIKIINEIAVGCIKSGAEELSVKKAESKNTKNHTFFKIPNRKEAIEFAIATLAKPGDIILLCGKGHESSMNYNGKELPWSEHQAVKDALKKRKK